jgi:hypothetical protein
VAALNHAGQALGRDRTFKTTGHPPAAVVTGPPSSVRKTIVTVTGTINPNGAPTTYEFQYGTSTAYGLLTGPQTLAAGTSPVPVSATITGVAPATLFHYRLVAFHGALSTAGGDATFFTEPDHRPKPTVGARTKPGVDRHAPYTFTTSGVLRGANFIPASSRCAGRVGLRYYKGHRQVAFVLAPVGSNCRFIVKETVRRRFVHGPTAIRIAIHFRGNGYLAPADRTNHVTAG